MANVLFSRDAVSLAAADGSAPATIETRTSKAVVRHRCASCYSPVFATLGPKRAVLPAALFGAPLPEAWKPAHHIYYDSRVLDVPDGAPKYRRQFGGATCDDAGKDSAPPPAEEAP